MSSENNPMLWDPEWEDWYRLTPQERWRESMKLREFYLAAGGSLDPEFDFVLAESVASTPAAVSADGRASVRIVRRSPV
jgi:hypothetical protein